MHRRDFLLASVAISAGIALTTGAGLPAAAVQRGTSPAAGLTPPSQRQGQFVELNGARIFYEVTGRGQPLLLITAISSRAPCSSAFATAWRAGSR